MKKRIVIASILKPADDVRAYWKLSQSIAKTNKYEVNIIGNAPKKDISDKNIHLHPHQVNRNQWLKRLIIREKILFQTLKLNPSILIITTHELLNVALIVKLITRCKIIYDVQENYYANLNSINTSFFKRIYASLIRFKETFSRHFIDEYWLAESCYQNELSFVKTKCVVLENKASFHPISERQTRPVRMLFSGTLSYYSGIDIALACYHSVQSNFPDSSLHIIGQIHDDELKKKLKSEAKMHQGITLRISKYPIPHREILDAIMNSNLGLITYSPTDVNQDKIPTKLYEYSRYQLPYIVQENTKWSSVGEQLGGAISVDFSNLDVQVITKTLQNPSYLFPDEYPDEATWEYESSKIKDSLNRLVNKQ
ncbi:hypothetical protein [Ekhidna sp.]|uniref:hypothetical protein n=1 Tax=Ekhidna sp. TaxID=2608089 RepID=UPI003CCBF266